MITSDLSCKKCGCENLIKVGTQMASRAGGKQQRLQCKGCGHIFLVPMESLYGQTKETSE